MRQTAYTWFLRLKTFFVLILFAACGSDSNDSTQMVVLNDIPIPMRDGVVLRGDVWKPAESGRFPVLIYRTPYGKTEEEEYNRRTFENAVKRGYVMLTVDVRGRYRSEGVYTPYRHEGQDGYDTIEWAAAQERSDGRIGTFGLSYPGAVQWLAGIEDPPHLKAMVPAGSFSSMRHFIYFGGVFEVAWTGWVYKEMSWDARVRYDLPGPRTYADAIAEYNRLGAGAFADPLPLMSMDLLRDAAPYYYEWLENPPESSYWDFGEIKDHYANISAAVLTLSGWYDEPYGPHGAADGFTSIARLRSGERDPRTRMVIGPWIHGAYKTELAYAGDRNFAPAAAIDYDELVLDWADRYVREIDNGEEHEKRVKVYLMGADRWIEDDQWPLTGTEYRDIYLGSSAGRGALAWTAVAGEAGSTFTADPGNQVNDPYGTNFGAYDLAYLADRSDVLTFDSEVLQEDVAVVGPITAELFVSADASDYDLYVKLIDVAPDGVAFNLMSPGQEVLRASYRLNGRPRRPVQPGEVLKLDFTNLVTGNMFKRGHKIRVNVCASWRPLYARNLQTGESEMYSAAYEKADITVHHEPGRQSRLTLPIVPLRSGWGE